MSIFFQTDSECSSSTVQMNTGYSSHRTRALFYHQSGLILSTLTMYHEETKELFFTVWFIPCNITASRHEKCLLGRLLHLSLVKKWSVSWTRNSKVAGSSLSHSAVRSGNNLENVVCTHGASVTNSIIWYWSRGCDSLQLER